MRATQHERADVPVWGADMSEANTAASWYSDEALRKQAALAEWPKGTPPPLSMIVGIEEPRVQPTIAEKCVCCGLDARDEMGGEPRPEGRYCYLCIGRGHDERDAEPSARSC